MQAFLFYAMHEIGSCSESVGLPQARPCILSRFYTDFIWIKLEKSHYPDFFRKLILPKFYPDFIWINQDNIEIKSGYKYMDGTFASGER